MPIIPARIACALAILTTAVIPAGAAFAAGGGNANGGFNGGFVGAGSPNRGAGQTVFTSHGPATTTGGAGSYQTTSPARGAGQGQLMNNGNGTSTLIGPRGDVTTVPTPG